MPDPAIPGQGLTEEQIEDSASASSQLVTEDEIPITEIKDRALIREVLNTAVSEICKQDPNFLGLLLFGSFVGEGDFQDIDILPVLKVQESDRENPYSMGQALIEKYFKPYFPDFPEPKLIHKSGLNGTTDYRSITNILHAGQRVIYLDQPKDLERLMNLTSDSNNFIGSEEIQKMINKKIEIKKAGRF